MPGCLASVIHSDREIDPERLEFRRNNHYSVAAALRNRGRFADFDQLAEHAHLWSDAGLQGLDGEGGAHLR